MVYSAFPRSVMRQVALSTGPRMRLANTSTAADHPLACPSISHESFPANGSHQSTTLQLLFPLQLLEGLTLMLFAKLFLFLEFRSGHNLVRSSALICKVPRRKLLLVDCSVPVGVHFAVDGVHVVRLEIQRSQRKLELVVVQDPVAVKIPLEPKCIEILLVLVRQNPRAQHLGLGLVHRAQLVNAFLRGCWIQRPQEALPVDRGRIRASEQHGAADAHVLAFARGGEPTRVVPKLGLNHGTVGVYAVSKLTVGLVHELPDFFQCHVSVAAAVDLVEHVTLHVQVFQRYQGSRPDRDMRCGWCFEHGHHRAVRLPPLGHRAAQPREARGVGRRLLCRFLLA
mmetsp:Transcript_1157/g.2411  ORF Transcript_1157/g.2411 Transcript_1157/m.2411 type:complete len:340 (-) Transcript_1157:739-1758(-)